MTTLRISHPVLDTGPSSSKNIKIYHTRNVFAATEENFTSSSRLQYARLITLTQNDEVEMSNNAEQEELARRAARERAEEEEKEKKKLQELEALRREVKDLKQLVTMLTGDRLTSEMLNLIRGNKKSHDDSKTFAKELDKIQKQDMTSGYRVTDDHKYEFDLKELENDFKTKGQKGESYVFVPRLNKEGNPLRTDDGKVIQDVLIFNDGKLTGAHIFDPQDGHSIGPKTLDAANRAKEALLQGLPQEKKEAAQEDNVEPVFGKAPSAHSPVISEKPSVTEKAQAPAVVANNVRPEHAQIDTAAITARDKVVNVPRPLTINDNSTDSQSKKDSTEAVRDIVGALKKHRAPAASTSPRASRRSSSVGVDKRGEKLSHI